MKKKMTVEFDGSLLTKDDKKSKILFPAHGLMIYEFMVEKASKNNYVKKEEVLEHFGYSENGIILDKDVDRDWRYYMNDVEFFYWASVIGHCFDFNGNGYYITTPADKYEKHMNNLKREAFKASQYKEMATTSGHTKLSFKEVL